MCPGSAMDTTGSTAPEHDTPLELRPEEGCDELNLAEFPLALLSQRVPEGAEVLVFSDTVRLGRQEVTRRLTVTGSPLHGLPTPADEDVLVGLIALSKGQNFAERVVPFTRSALLRVLGWPASGQSYDRLARSLRRWLAVTLQYERAWWDRETGHWVDASFHVLDAFTLPSRGAPGAPRSGKGELVCTFTWNECVLRSFRSGNLKKLDLAFYFDLTLAPARRIYRFLDKRFYHSTRLDFDLREFATEHVGLSRGHRDAGKIKEKLAPSIEELERAGFLAPLSREQRYQRLGRGNWRVHFVRGGAEGSPTDNGRAGHDLAGELRSRGVSRSATAELVAGYPEETLRAHIAVHDAIRRRGGLGIRNLPGYLVVSVREGRPPPRGIAPARPVPQTAAPAARVPPDAPPEGASAAERYVAGLAPAERQRFETEAVARGQHWVRAQYERNLAEGRSDLARHFLEVMLRQFAADLLARGVAPADGGKGV